MTHLVRRLQMASWAIPVLAQACTVHLHAQPAPGDTLIQKGLYLAQAGDCIACHTVPGGKLFAGGREMRTPYGTMYSPNITPDMATGIGAWSTQSFYDMMHNGRAPDGGLIYPAMPFGSYTKVTRADSDAIFAYMKSVPPVALASKPHELRFPFNNRSLILGWRTLFFTEGTYASDPAKSEVWNRGAYLVQGLGHCTMCHTAMNALGGTSQSQLYQGGLIPMQNWYAPSLVSNKEIGLGAWSIDDVSSYLRDGISHRGAAYGPMAEVTYDSLQHLTIEDTRAIAVYLKSLAEGEPPDAVSSIVPEAENNLLVALGKTIYDGQCATCHGAHGKGSEPNYPPLAGNQSIQLNNGVNTVRVVLSGGYPPGTAANPMPYGMPPFAQSLSDPEIAAVATYIRSSWGNHGIAVSADAVRALRAGPQE